MKTPSALRDDRLELLVFGLVVIGRGKALHTHGITPELFVNPALAECVRASEELLERGRTPSVETIPAYLAETGRMPIREALSVVESAVIDARGTEPGTVELAIERLRTLAQPRLIAEVAGAAAAKASRGELLEAVESIRSLLQKLDSAEAATDVTELRDEVHRWMGERIASQGAPKRELPRTGFPNLDARIKGLRPGACWFVGGRSGCRKSSMMLLSAIAGAADGYSPAIISLEDSKALWAERAAYWCATEETEMGLVLGAERAQRIPLRISAPLDGTPKDVLDCARQLVMREGCRMLFVDYMQALTIDANVRRYDKAIANVARSLKRLCAAYNAVLVLGSQITTARGQSGKEPSANDLKESGDFTSIAEVITVLWKADTNDDAPVLGRLAKLKWGPEGLPFTLHVKRGVVVGAVSGHPEQARGWAS